MCFFWKKKAKTRRPSFYGEWLNEFKTASDRLLTAEKSIEFAEGELKDAKLSLSAYQRSLEGFLSAQFSLFISAYETAVARITEEANCEYLILSFYRYDKLFKNLLFFEKQAFLPAAYRRGLNEQLSEKYRSFLNELIAYFEKFSAYSDCFAQAEIVLKRIIRGEI